MRFARRLLLLVGMAVAAMALSASTAAAEPVEVQDNGVHCGTLNATGHEVTGGCHFQAISVGDIHLELHSTLGIETTGPACENDFEVRLGGNGEGYVQHFAILPGDVECGVGVRACSEAEAHAPGNGPWHTRLEETGTDQVTATVEVCLIIPGNIRCEGPVSVAVTHDAEQYFAGVTDQGIPCAGGSRAEFSGDYILVNEPGHEVHVVHPVG